MVVPYGSGDLYHKYRPRKFDEVSGHKEVIKSIPNIIDRQEKWLKENPTKRVVPPIIHPEYIGNIYFGALTKKQEKRYNSLVDKHHATGKLTDEEEEKLKPQLDQKQLEELIPAALNDVEAGTIKSKRELWDMLKEKTGFTDVLLVRNINRHLKIRGFKNFNSFVI